MRSTLFGRATRDNARVFQCFSLLGNIIEKKMEEIELVDSDVGKGITENTLNSLRDLGFDVTVVMAVKLTAAGKKEHIKKLVYEKEILDDFFVEHLMTLRGEVPEVISEAEVRRIIQRRDENLNSLADGADRPKRVILKLEVQVHPSQDLSFVFRKTEERRKRGSVTINFEGFGAKVSIDIRW